MTVGTASRNLSPDVDGSSSGEIIAGPIRMEINRGLLTRSNPFAEVLRREVLVAKLESGFRSGKLVSVARGLDPRVHGSPGQARR